MAAAKTRRDRFAGLAAKAKDKQTREKYRQIAKKVVEQGAAAAKRLQIAADNAADSYARSMRNAAEAQAAEAIQAANKAKKVVKKAVKKAKA